MPLLHTYLSYHRQLYTHYYLCHYLPNSAGRDNLSHSLLKFKKGRHPDLEAWTDCSLESFTQAQIPPGATIVRAFHHYETVISPNPTSLDHLGQKLAARFLHYYHPSLLQKARLTTSMKTFSKPRREEELHDLYHLDNTLPRPPSRWIIIDDILTSGATVRAIIQAIRHACPLGQIEVFTLARAVTTPPLYPASLTGRNYRFEEDTGWIRAF